MKPKADACVSCGIALRAMDTYVEFPCPNCGKSLIRRCSKCKKLVRPYKCSNCGFEGP